LTSSGAFSIAIARPAEERRRGSPSYGRIERGEAPLLPTLPLPLIREGGQGDRLLNNLDIGS